MNKTVKNHYAALSDAIRADHRPQAFGTFVKRSRIFRIVRTCALAGAYEALTGKLDVGGDKVTDFLTKLYPYSNEKVELLCPASLDCSTQWRDLQFVIMHLNDYHRWSKARIADYVEKYEEEIGFIHLVEGEENAQEKLSEGIGKGSDRNSVVPETAGYVISII